MFQEELMHWLITSALVIGSCLNKFKLTSSELLGLETFSNQLSTLSYHDAASMNIIKVKYLPTTFNLYVRYGKADVLFNITGICESLLIPV